MLTPVWDTDTVYGESFTMYKDKDGETRAKFLYKPESVIEVRSASLETLFVEGRDYRVVGDELVLCENSTIPIMEYEDVFLTENQPGKCFAYPGGYLRFGEGHYFHDRQIAVTYKCKKGDWGGYVPKYKGDLLYRTVNRLSVDRELKIVLLGDSISAGYNASGVTFANPFQPRFIDLFAEKLRRAYGASVTVHNPSVPGKDSVWGMQVLDEAVIAQKPDLVVLAFGMNGRHEPATFESHIKNMIDRIKAENGETDIILIATTTPNPRLTDERAPFWGYQYLHGEILQKFETDGVALLDMGALQKELHKKKRFIDTTGNNVNHPNDFFVRIHAQALSALLIK